MKPPSSPSEPGLLDRLDGDPEIDAAVGDQALVAAMLRTEAAMARAGATAGALPEEAAEAIAQTCRTATFDLADLAARAVSTGAPVAPLVADLGEQLPAHAKPWVHFGATTQDVLDTALMLLARDVIDRTEAALGDVARGCVRLAELHRDTMQVARTVGQQALPSTFGAKVAGWLVGVDEARTRLANARAKLASQYGGAAGTLAPLGDVGVEVMQNLAEELDLAEPIIPWHTNRGRIHDLAGALGSVTAALGKIATDVVLCAQVEVGELGEPAGAGGSSAMPHKQNPIRSALVIAAARRTPGLVGTLFATSLGEHERATGSWHAEWQPLRELLRLTGGAAVRMAEVLAGLRVNTGAMRRNLELTGGLLMTESVATQLAGALGRQEAQSVVGGAARRAVAEGSSLRTVLLADDTVRSRLSTADIDAALDPAGYVGNARRFVDRALVAHDLYHREDND